MGKMHERFQVVQELPLEPVREVFERAVLGQEEHCLCHHAVLRQDSHLEVGFFAEF